MANKITVTNLKVELEYGTDRTLIASWGFKGIDGEPLDHYMIEWQYDTGNGVALGDGPKDVGTLKHNTFNAPNNAIKAKVHVKPIGAEKKDSNGKKTGERYLADAAWCGWKEYNFANKVYVFPLEIPKLRLTSDLYDGETFYLSGVEEGTMCVDLSYALEDAKGYLSSCAAYVTENSMRTDSTERTIGDVVSEYECQWSYYDAVNDKWVDQDSSTTSQSIVSYKYPAGVNKIRFRVRLVPSTFTAFQDGQEYPCFSNAYTNWKELKISDYMPEPNNIKGMIPEQIAMKFAPGSTTDIQISWVKWWEPEEYTKIIYQSPNIRGAALLNSGVFPNMVASYDYQWAYKDRNGIVHAEGGNTAARNVTVTIPDSFVTLVKFRVKPVANTYSMHGTQWPHFNARWSAWKEVKNLRELEAKIPAPIRDGKEIQVSNISVVMKKGGTDTWYAKWNWDANNTAGYSVEWGYSYGDGEWFDGDPDDITGASNRKSLYSIPDASVKKIRVRIKPLCDYTYGYWRKEFTQWQEVAVTKEADVPPAPNITKVTISQYKDTSMYAEITWNKDHTDHYQYQWMYYSQKHNKWFAENVETSTDKLLPQHNFDEFATQITLKVMPVAATYTDDYGRDVAYWKPITEWDDLQPIKPTFKMADLDPSDLSGAPGLDILSGNYLKATVENYNTTTAKEVEFAIEQDHRAEIMATAKATLVNGYAELKYRVPSEGHEYRVRARGVSGPNKVGAWSDWSSSVSTGPKTPEKLISVRADGPRGVRVTWTPVSGRDASESLDITYEIEYIDNLELFDVSGRAKSEETSTNTSFYHIDFTSDDDFGKTWYFRVRAKLGENHSGWTNIVSCTLAKKPSVPTTWSENGVIGLGQIARLYWVHNAEDNSNETEATIVYYKSTDPTTPIEIVYTDEPSDENVSDMIHSYEIDTSTFETGCLIFWKVKTKGAADEYSDFSVERQIGVYDDPTVAFSIPSEFTSFPITFTAVAEPPQQTAIVWNVSIVALEGYDTVDNVGNDVRISKNETIYSKFIDISGNTLEHTITAADVTFENGIRYELIVDVGMDSGLSARASREFVTNYDFDVMEPEGTITLDREHYSASIRPVCYDSSGEVDDDVTLSVYRREYDGRLVLLATGLENTGYTSIIDPHPALDFARYRIVAKSKTTGRMTHTDISSSIFGIPGVVLQWGANWATYDPTQDYNPDEPSWDGTTLHLPYNANISEQTSIDVSLIEYIGRSAPVSYYGTQLGISGSISCTIRADDYDTIYALRRLSIYRGDVYVRSSNGIGYWAQVTVSFEKTNREVTIPVTIDIKRVEGGI